MKNETLPRVICATCYDKNGTTKFIKNILEKYPNKDFKFIDLEDKQISYKELIDSKKLNKPGLFIFGGHGSVNKLHVKGNFEEETSIFYSKSDFDLGPRILVAFACLAGKGLGVSFTKETNGDFFGFTTKISFIQKSEYKDYWTEIFHEIIDEIDKKETVDSSVILTIENIYNKILKKFDSEEESEYEYARMMRMFLREQLKGIYRGNEL